MSDATTPAGPASGGPATGGTFFYGWFVVGAVFVMLAVASGLGFYNLTVYLRALTTEQGMSVGAVSGATAVFFLVSGFAGIPIAAIIARRDPRPVVAVGALLAGTALVLLGRVDRLWQVYAVYAVFGLGFAAAGLVPGTTVVTRWFSRRRSVALSVASTGLSVGGIVLTPLSARLIDAHGLDAVTPWLALAFVVGIVPVTSALLRPSPASMGLWPDGDPAPADPVAAASEGTSWPHARSSRFFVLLTGAYVLVMLAQVGGLAHHFNLVSERVDERTAATAVSLVAGASVVGRLAGGVIVTRMSMRAFTLLLMLAQGAALLALGGGDTRMPLLLGSLGFGITVGNLLMLHPLLLAEAFGVRDYGRIYARSQFVMTLGVAAGPAVLGAVHDIVDGYFLPLTLAAAASIAAAGVLAASGPSRFSVAATG